ncbi:AAA family ATPase [Clostridium perfringens]
MKKVELTALSWIENDMFIKNNIGSKVKIVKSPNSKDPKALLVTTENGTKGYITNKANALIGPMTGHEIYDDLNDESIGIIKSFGTQYMGRTMVLIEVEVEDEGKEFIGSEEYILIFKGTYKKYPKKIEVIDSINNGNNVKGYLAIQNDKDFACIIDNETIGICDLNKLDTTTQSKIYSYVKNSYEKIAVNCVEVEGQNIKAILLVSKNKEAKDCKNPNAIKSIDKIIEEVVNNNFATKEKCLQVVKYLTDNNVKERHIVKVFESYKEYPENLKSLIPTPNTYYDDYLGLINKNILYMNISKHLRIVGDKGTGKNKIIETLAWIFNRPLLRLSVSRELDKLDLLGSQKLENGNIVFEPGIVPIAMEYGCILNLDEINTANPGLLTLLHSATDWSGALNVPGYKVIKADKNFCLISTMNENYSGTVDLNEATKDRFVTIRVSYPKKISIVLKNQVNAPQEVFDWCDSLFEGILNSVKNGDLPSEFITVRGYINAIEVYNEGLDFKEAIIDNVVNLVEQPDEREALLEDIINMVL